MARIRTIKPSFFTSLRISDLSLHARLTFIGLWTHCDDAGRCRADARLIRAALWPLDDRTPEDIENDIKELLNGELVATYEVRGRDYLQVAQWLKHQRTARPSMSELPAPPEHNDRILPDPLPSTSYKKRVIPNSVRREVAVKYGCEPGAKKYVVTCHYCSATGRIHWPLVLNGKPGSWVTFDLELHHVVPESKGGPTTAENIVLACRSCNRSKGAGGDE